MRRVLWMAGLAGLPACIEEHGPLREGEVDAGASVDADRPTDPRDAGAPDAVVPRDARPPVEGTPDAAPPDAARDAENLPPDQGVADATPPDPPPFQCPPEGRPVFSVGACVLGPMGPPEGPVAFVLDGEIDNGEADVESWFGEDCEGWATLGRPEGPAMHFTGHDALGQRFDLLVTLPMGLVFSGAPTWVDFNVSELDVFGPGAGSLILRSDDGHQPLVILTGGARFNSFEGGGLSLERGAQACYAEDDDEFLCTYTGYDLQATAAGETRAVAYGHIESVGPFAVIHAGLMSIGDRGACNAAPESYTLAAVKGL